MKIKDRKKKELPEVSTASLPDIIFMLLFFFMVVTVMKTRNIEVDMTLPETKYSDKVKPIKGTTEIQLSSSIDKILINDQWVAPDQFENYLAIATKGMTPSEIMSKQVHLRADKGCSMQSIYNLKLELRKVGLRKLKYVVEKAEQVD